MGIDSLSPSHTQTHTPPHTPHKLPGTCYQCAASRGEALTQQPAVGDPVGDSGVGCDVQGWMESVELNVVLWTLWGWFVFLNSLASFVY